MIRKTTLLLEGSMLLKKFLLYLKDIKHKRNILKPSWFLFFLFRNTLNGFPSIFFFKQKQIVFILGKRNAFYLIIPRTT